VGLAICGTPVISVTVKIPPAVRERDVGFWEGAITFSKAIWSCRVAHAVAVISTSPALASTGSDGHWNVRISSSCPSGASFTIAIEKRQLASAGGTFNASGRVGDGGNFSVTMSSKQPWTAFRGLRLGHLAGRIVGRQPDREPGFEGRTWSLSCPALLRRQLAACAQDHRTPYNCATHFAPCCFLVVRRPPDALRIDSGYRRLRSCSRCRRAWGLGAGGLVLDLGVGALLLVLCLLFVAAALFRRTIPVSSALRLVLGVSAPARCETARDLSCQCPREIGRGDR
jgi:hypothetical protein